ncbi:hypothetical protein GCM10023201_52390 [Actinomycetospora corticicola]|uniref:Uncharacterized protein n=1 Tax=Actinomycetospora corticicola TaxID=663602 RepID=A0A7Y9DXX9_9PSEU|nr:hypothetical protein [Actinomycetospora corticicola]
MSPSDARTAELGVPVVRQAAHGIALTTLDEGHRPGCAETPPRDRIEPTPLWPWVLGIGFAFLVGWVIPAPGTDVGADPAATVQEVPAGG